MMREDNNYQAWLLRCWCEGGEWRFSLHDAAMNRPKSLPSADHVVNYIMKQLSVNSRRLSIDGEHYQNTDH